MKKIVSMIVIVIATTIGWYFLRQTPSSAPSVEVNSPVATESPSTIQIITFGDSLTAGYGLPLSESYPAQLEQRLQERSYSVRVINSGVSGETTAGNAKRADFIRSQNPDIVILGIGGNDALRFLPVEAAYANMQSTLSTLLATETPPQVILLSMQVPSNAGGDYKKSFDALYPRLAAEFSVPLVPFIVEEVSRNPEFLQADGIHPTGDGYTLLVDTYILPAVELLLSKDTL